MPRPETGLVESSLFTGSPTDPRLVHELIQELGTADSVDILVSFIIPWVGDVANHAGTVDLGKHQRTATFSAV